MQVGVNVMCMHTSFDGCGLSGFEDIATFQKRQNFPFRAWTKNLIYRNRLKKFMQVGIDIKPTKVSVHALDINPYFREFFEPIPIE